MMATVKQTGDTPSDIEALLPWHAAGTLNARDARRVDEALANDPALARQYAVIRDELAEAIHLNENLGAPSTRAMRKLFAAIDAEPARRPRASFHPAARLAAFFASLSPRTLAYAASAAVLALVVQAGVIGTIVVKERGATYGTASQAAKQATGGAYALVRFAPEARAADIAAFLDRAQASIVDGPKAGMFRVRIGETALPRDELDRRIARMQDDAVISFAAAAE
ncbi:MAG: hypothetical protein EPO23_00245 [Xanthobacteraceae bacterium]|nr:MAG: hypothetical protein EPO23_00245 [Xanthobacteraceae bacterium]